MAGLLRGTDNGSTVLKMTVRSVTAEDNRVSIEASGDSRLKDGRKYNNSYQFTFTLSNGKIREVREYSDTKLTFDTFYAVAKPACK